MSTYFVGHVYQHNKKNTKYAQQSKFEFTLFLNTPRIVDDDKPILTVAMFEISAIILSL